MTRARAAAARRRDGRRRDRMTRRRRRAAPPDEPVRRPDALRRARRAVLLRPRRERAIDRGEPPRVAADAALRRRAASARARCCGPASRTTCARRARSALARGACRSRSLVVFSGWRDEPLGALVDAIGRRSTRSPAASERRRRGHWSARRSIRRRDERTSRTRSAADRARRAAELLLVLDQFEEYFLYHRDEDGDGTLAAELPRAVNARDLRANFLDLDPRGRARAARPLQGPDPEPLRQLPPARAPRRDGAPARRSRGPSSATTSCYPPATRAVRRSSPSSSNAVLDQVRAGAVALGQAGRGHGRDDGHGDRGRSRPRSCSSCMSRLWERGAPVGLAHAARRPRSSGSAAPSRSSAAHLDDALAALDAARRRTSRPRSSASSSRRPGRRSLTLVPPISRSTRRLPSRSSCRSSRRSPAQRGSCARSPRRRARRRRAFEIFHDVLAPAILDWRAAHEQARAAREAAARRRMVRRRLAAGGSTMLLLVVVFAGLAIWALGQRSEAQKQAEVARSQALAASAVSQLDADPELGLLLAVEAAEGEPTREAEDALRRALTSSRLRAVVPTRGPVRSAAISPDDSRVLTVDGLGTAHVRSATGGGGDLASFGAGLVNDAAFDPTGRLIVTASKDGTARIVDASRGEERLVIRAGSAPVVAARFSRDGHRVLTVSRDGVARTFDARTGKRGADARVRSPLGWHLFSPRGEAVLLVGRGGDARVWRWQSGEPARRSPRPSRSPTMAASRSGEGSRSLQASAPDDFTGELLIVDSRTGVRKKIFVPGGALSIAFSPGGRFVATAGTGDGPHLGHAPETLRPRPPCPSRPRGRNLRCRVRPRRRNGADGERRWLGPPLARGHGRAARRLPQPHRADKGAVLAERKADRDDPSWGCARLGRGCGAGAVRATASAVYENPPIQATTFTRDGAHLSPR